MRACAIAIVLCALLLAGCQQQAGSGNTTTTTAQETAVLTVPTATQTVPTTEAATEPTTEPVWTPDSIIESMTLEQKVGQLFLARCPESKAIADVENYHLGGYILFGRDFKNQTPDSIRNTIGKYQAAAEIPLLIAVDEEGGTVTRVSNIKAFRDKKFPSPRSLYASGGMELVLSTEAEKSCLLASLGINVNMAPVCDVTTDPDSFMYKRSLGESPETTGQFAAGAVKTMAEYRVGSVLKHFPGYGNNTDTHTGIAHDRRSLSELEGRDLIPFAYGIDAGCDAILISHTIVECLDGEIPASLSPAVHGYLRSQMGFEGVIVTDDLVMQAITDLYGDGEAAVLAVLAGNDLLCATNYVTQYQAVLQAVESGRIPGYLLDQAVARILYWKHELGLIV